MGRTPLRSLGAKITAGVVAAVVAIGCGSLWFLQASNRRQIISSLADSTTAHGKLVEESLRWAMRTRQLELLDEMVRSLGAQSGVERVVILNKKGVIRYSSHQQERGLTLAPSDPTCLTCHRTTANLRGRTVIFAREDGSRVFRNVTPILNGSACYGCHPSHDRVNGVLIVDYSMAGVDSSLRTAAWTMWSGAVTLALTTAAVIIGLMRVLVVNRLRNLVQVVDSIRAGRFRSPAEVRGADEIAQLGQAINGMAESLEESLGTLREREAFLDAVINSADDGIVVVDEGLRVVTANRAFARMPDGPRSGTSGEPCRCAGSYLTASRDDCPARSTLATGQVTHCVRAITLPDGTMRHYEIACSPIFKDGKAQEAIEVWRDITDRREMEASLASSDRLASLGLLAAGVSHEINNPLASITTCLDGLERRIRTEEGGRPIAELAEYLKLIRGEVTRCCELTERLKVLGRRPRQMPQAVDIGAVVSDTVALMRFMAKDAGIELEVRPAADPRPVFADEQQLRQVVLNLVLNAIQAVDGPGWVRISTRPGVGATVAIEVADSGRGIEPTDLPRIFEPFCSLRPDGGGSGLGLFIVKIIVEQSDGSIAVSSTPGEGTTFTVVLPSAPGAARGAVE